MAAAAQARATGRVQQAGAGQCHGHRKAAHGQPRLVVEPSDADLGSASGRQPMTLMTSGSSLVLPLQQQHVAGLDLVSLSQPFAERLAARREMPSRWTPKRYFKRKLMALRPTMRAPGGTTTSVDGHVLAGEQTGLLAFDSGVLELLARDELLDVLGVHPSITSRSPLRMTAWRAIPARRLPRRMRPTMSISLLAAAPSSSRTFLSIIAAPAGTLASAT